MDDVFWSLLFASLGAMAKVFIICVIGVTAGLLPRSDPVLSKQTLKGMSRVLTTIVVPATLIAGWGLSLSVEILSQLWVILPWSTFNTVLSFLVAWPAFRFLNLPGKLSVVLTAGCAFHNSVSLPWLLLDSLCTQGAFPTVLRCREQAAGCCFVYLIPFHLLFWTVGYAIFMEDTPTNTDPKSVAQPPLEDVNADHEVPDPELPSTSLVRSESSCCSSHTLLNSRPKEKQMVESHGMQLHCCTKDVISTLKRVFLTPAMVAMPFALLCGLVTPLRQYMFEASTPLTPFGAAVRTLADTMLGTSTLILAGSLVAQDNWLSGSHIPKKFTLIPLFIGVRLIIVPTLGIAVFLAVKQWLPFLVGDALTQVTIVMEFACPSSMSAVMLLQASGRQDLASVLAYLYVFQHLAAVIILTLVTSMAMYFATVL